MKARLTRLVTPQLAAWTLACIAAIGLLCFRLGTLLPKLRVEHSLPTIHDSVQIIWNHPLGLPILVSRLVVSLVLPNGGLAASRLPSVLLGLALISSTYWLLLRWYGYRLALFGTILLATAPWFLHVSRLATNDIVYPLAMIITLLLSSFWHQKERRLRLLYISGVFKILMFYIPGGVWLLLCLTLSERRNILATLQYNKKHALYASIVPIIIIVPLVHAFIGDWHIYRSLLGLPAVFPSIVHFGKQFLETWEYIFFRGYANPNYNLSSLPIVDVFTSLAFATGVYLYAKHPKASRTKLLASLWLVGSILVALHGPVHISVVMPIVAVLATGGIGYLLHLWLRVFPRNPLARAFGISLIGLVIVFAVTYSIRNYYVAWPHSPSTRAAFQVKQ